MSKCSQTPTLHVYQLFTQWVNKCGGHRTSASMNCFYFCSCHSYTLMISITLGSWLQARRTNSGRLKQEMECIQNRVSRFQNHWKSWRTMVCLITTPIITREDPQTPWFHCCHPHLWTSDAVACSTRSLLLHVASCPKELSLPPTVATSESILSSHITGSGFSAGSVRLTGTREMPEYQVLGIFFFCGCRQACLLPRLIRRTISKTQNGKCPLDWPLMTSPWAWFFNLCIKIQWVPAVKVSQGFTFLIIFLSTSNWLFWSWKKRVVKILVVWLIYWVFSFFP